MNTDPQQLGDIIIGSNAPDRPIYNPDAITFREDVETLPTSVIQAIAAVKATVGAVGKDRQVRGRESYAYRGIDDILAAVQRRSAEAGVVIIPRDLELHVEPWTYYQGDAWRLYRLEIEWTIYGPAGDSIVTRNWGEALDNSDKALGKARSYAQKDLLVRIYEIPTGDPELGDTEATTFHEREQAPVATLDRVQTLRDGLAALLVETDNRYPREWVEARLPRLEKLDEMLAGELRPLEDQRATEAAEALTVATERIEREQIAAQLDEPTPPDPEHCQICGSTRASRVLVDGTWRCANAADCTKRREQLEQEFPNPDDGDPERPF